MRLERRFSSMTSLSTLTTFELRELIKKKVLSIWFNKMQKDFGFKLLLDEYIKLVEEWEFCRYQVKCFSILGALLTLISVCLIFLGFSTEDPGPSKACLYISAILFPVILFYTYLSIQNLKKASRMKPRRKEIRLVEKYRSLALALDTTTLWIELKPASDTDDAGQVFNREVSRLSGLNSEEVKLPQFLIDSAWQRLRLIGEDINVLENQGKLDKAMRVRNGVFRRCYVDAVEFGAIPENTNWGMLIPPLRS